MYSDVGVDIVHQMGVVTFESLDLDAKAI
jgi:hypothetical protein